MYRATSAVAAIVLTSMFVESTHADFDWGSGTGLPYPSPTETRCDDISPGSFAEGIASFALLDFGLDIDSSAYWPLSGPIYQTRHKVYMLEPGATEYTHVTTIYGNGNPSVTPTNPVLNQWVGITFNTAGSGKIAVYSGYRTKMGILPWSAWTPSGQEHLKEIGVSIDPVSGP